MPFGAACLAGPDPASTPATDRPVVASSALRTTLSRGAPEPAPGRVLAVLPAALYVQVAGDVVAVVTGDGLRLPNALVLPQDRRQAPFAVHREGGPATLVDGVLRVGVGAGAGSAVGYRPVREWTPRPHLPGAPDPVQPSAVELLARRLGGGPASGEPRAAERLATATSLLQSCLSARDLDGVRAAADALVGLGPGLTPAGDDVLAGALVTCGQLRACPGAAPVAALAAALGQHVSARAATRTTALSAALLRHAAHGLAATPVLAVVDALVGQCALGPALTDLLAVGHTSGHDTARGVLAAAAALLTAAGPLPAAAPAHPPEDL